MTKHLDHITIPNPDAINFPAEQQPPPAVPQQQLPPMPAPPPSHQVVDTLYVQGQQPLLSNTRPGPDLCTALYVNGNAEFRENSFAQSHFSLSDVRKKLCMQVFKLVEEEAVRLQQLHPLEFTYVHDPSQRERVGFSAQEVQNVMPRAVVEEGGKLYIDYPAILAYFWAYVQRCALAVRCIPQSVAVLHV